MIVVVVAVVLSCGDGGDVTFGDGAGDIGMEREDGEGDEAATWTAGGGLGGGVLLCSCSIV